MLCRLHPHCVDTISARPYGGSAWGNDVQGCRTVGLALFAVAPVTLRDQMQEMRGFVSTNHSLGRAAKPLRRPTVWLLAWLEPRSHEGSCPRRGIKSCVQLSWIRISLRVRGHGSEQREIEQDSSFCPGSFWPFRYFATDQCASDRSS